MWHWTYEEGISKILEFSLKAAKKPKMLLLLKILIPALLYLLKSVYFDETM